MTTNEEAELYLKTYLQLQDNEALGKLYVILAPSVYSFIWSMTHDEEEAKDSVQEAFLIVASKADQYKMGTSVRNWIFEIARNVALQRIKKGKRFAPLEEIDPYSHLASYEEKYEETPLLDLAKKILPEDEKTIVSLHIIGEMKHKEIADLLNMPLGTVTWKYKKAIDALKIAVKKGGYIYE